MTERDRERKRQRQKKNKPGLFWDFKTLRKSESLWQATIDEHLPKLISSLISKKHIHRVEKKQKQKDRFQLNM